MGLLPQTEQNAGKLQILRSDNQRELQLWLVDQVTILAEAFGEELTSAKLRLYAEDLCDLPAAQLGAALTRALPWDYFRVARHSGTARNAQSEQDIYDAETRRKASSECAEFRAQIAIEAVLRALAKE